MNLSDIPEFAETIAHTDVMRQGKGQSVFAPKHQTVVWELHCPACEEVSPLPKLYTLHVCKCGLHLFRADDGALIWRPRSPEADKTSCGDSSTPEHRDSAVPSCSSSEAAGESPAPRSTDGALTGARIFRPAFGPQQGGKS